MFTLFISCKQEVLHPSFEKNGVAIVFDKENWSNYYISTKIFEKSDYTQIIFSSILVDDYVSITQAKGLGFYENLQKGKRNYCPPDYLPVLPTNFRVIPSHTEVFNDSTYVLGSLWFAEYEFEDNNSLSAITGNYGWQFTILKPNSATFIDLWTDNGDIITLDSLLRRSKNIRDGITIIIE